MGKYRIKPQVAARLRTILLILVIAYFSYQLINQEIRLRKQDEQITQMQEQYDALAESNSQLQNQFDYTQSDEYREQFARDALNMTEDGEIRFEEDPGQGAGGKPEEDGNQPEGGDGEPEGSQP